MALDEYLYGKISDFFRKKRKSSLDTTQAVNLEEVKNKLTIFARAISGEPITIFPAEREGGYKNNNFFLPISYNEFQNHSDNLSFYLFRVLFLTVQKKQELNWNSGVEYPIELSRKKALDASTEILPLLFDEFPICKTIHSQIKSFYDSKKTEKKPADFSFIYGKWMVNSPEDESKKKLTPSSNKLKKAIQEEIKTILKANPVEDIISVEVDLKQQEDFVLTHQFEKVETAEEHDGGWRDFDGEDELDKHSKALEELNMKYTVRVDDPTHSIYQADFVENITVSESSETSGKEHSISYDEWDYAKRKYKTDFCQLFPKSIQESDFAYYKKTISDNSSTLIGLRKMLTNVNNRMQQQRRQPQGDEFDLDALTDLFIDTKSGHTSSENVYLSKRKKEKDLSILMLLDTSLSTDGYAADNRVIDVEKKVSILFGEILNEFNVDFSIHGFHSKTRNFATYTTLKGFDEQWNKAKHKIGAIQPEGYTRIGTALRHSGALLDSRDTKNKWVILISDGKPNDYDKYEGKYGINDVKQALRELNEKNINSYALAIEANAKYYLPQMFGTNHYQILTTPTELLQSMVKLYEKIKTLS